MAFNENLAAYNAVAGLYRQAMKAHRGTETGRLLARSNPHDFYQALMNNCFPGIRVHQYGEGPYQGMLTLAVPNGGGDWKPDERIKPADCFNLRHPDEDLAAFVDRLSYEPTFIRSIKKVTEYVIDCVSQIPYLVLPTKKNGPDSVPKIKFEHHKDSGRRTFSPL